MSYASRIALAFAIACCSLASMLAAETGSDGVKSPAVRPSVAQDDLAYLPLVESLIDAVGEGRIDEAVVILDKDSSKGVPEANRENLRRMLATIYGSSGKYDGHEVVTVQRITSRLHRVDALAYYERQPLLYTFTMYQFEGQWKINHVHWDDKIDRLEEIVQ